MDQFARAVKLLLQRQQDTGTVIEDLFKNPFAATLQSDSVLASFGTSIGFTLLIAVGFSLLRPYNSVVYAPKLKHADEKHAPPAMGKGVLAWFGPVLNTGEQDLVRYVGLDATIFLRFTRMCRNIFLVLSVIGCGILIPVNITLGNYFAGQSVFTRLTPLNTYGRPTWSMVVCAYLFNFVVAGFLWWNYTKVLALRRQYFESSEYQRSLHARTLMINDIPKNYRSDEGIGRVIDEVVPTSSFSRSAIARNVKELPDLIAEHNKNVRQLEQHLARYLRNPDQLPKARPQCHPSKEDPSYGTYVRNQKVDAIEYLSGRIKELEIEIKEVRLSVDKRNAMPYGFASFEEISEAHSIAFLAQKKHPQGTTIVLAPRPNDVIWKNMALGRSARRWKNIWNNVWVAILTLLWVAPNVGISVFLVNLANLGKVWPAFQTSLSGHTKWWAIVQGVASPAITSLIFLLLPIVFRRLSVRAGDQSKTARERHVTAKLYTFFVFNNLIVFSIFSVLWQFIVIVIADLNKGSNPWQAILDADIGDLLFTSLCNSSVFWITWLLQRNLGAAVELAQLWTLVWSFCVRKFSSPTPREMIELTAPPAFDYASYYNYFLFYSTVALVFATIQPLVLPAAALYFTLDVYLKKYLLLYIFVTKTESGGMFWRTLFNRLVFASIIANLLVFLSVWARGEASHIQAYATVPLPFLMVGFKIYCKRAFDDKIHFSSTGKKLRDPELDIVQKSLKSDRLASRYGHPALYKPLITPMVHARAQNILASIYRGRLTDSNNADSTDMASVSGYSDTFALDPMKAGQVGRSASSKNGNIPGFEVVPENKLDFSYYKNRAEFGDDHGGGQIYNRHNDLIDRPGTSNTFRGGYSSPGSSRTGSPAPYPGPHPAYTGTSSMAGSEESPYSRDPSVMYDMHGDVGSRRQYGPVDDDAARPLVHSAAETPISTPLGHIRQDSLDRRTPGFLGGGPQGYGGLPQQEEEIGPPVGDTSYDYFRGRRQNQGWQG